MRVKCPSCKKMVELDASFTRNEMASVTCPLCKSLLFMDKDLSASDSGEDGPRSWRSSGIESGITKRTKRCLILFIVFALVSGAYLYNARSMEKNLLVESLNSSAKAVLRQLVVAQEGYYAVEGRYAGDVAELSRSIKKKSSIIIRIDQADGKNWSAKIFHRKSPQWLVFDSYEGGFLGAFDRESD